MANLVFDFLHSYETGERRESEPASAYQYDEGRVLEAVLPSAVTSCEIHYWIRGQEKSEAYTPGSITQNQDGSCTVIGNIPNLYFETNGELRVYIVVTDGSASITTYEGYVHICQRSMPDDYVDDDPENEATRILTEALAAATTATQQAQAASTSAGQAQQSAQTLSQSVEQIATNTQDITSLKEDLSSMQTATASDVGKALKAKTVSGGKVTEWEFGSTGIGGELNILYLYGNESEIQTKWQNRDKSKMNFRYVFHNINENKQKNGWCKLSLQGNATLGYPKHNFNIQFYKDAGYKTKDKVDFMDLTDDKHPKWTLKANYNDYSQGRNVVSARLWGDVVHCRSNMSKALSDAPNHGAIDGHPVTVMMNDAYYGLYMYNMSKSDWMIGIDEDNPMHCAVSSNLATDNTKWLSVGLSGWELEIPDTWQSPEVDGVVTSVQAGFTALQTFVINSSDADFHAELSDYLDVPSAIDYLIYSFLVCNADSMNKNQFLVTWDAGKTWAFTAYDMDQTFGAGFTSEIPYTHNLFTTHPNHLFERLIANFYDEIMERYNILRSSVFSYNYVARELEMFFGEIPSGEREKDKEKYPGMMFQTISTLPKMQEFTLNRLQWCDRYFASLDPDYVPCTGITLNKSSISFTEVGDTDTLVATTTPSNCSDTVIWSSSNENVATVVNGVVTAVADGDCIITATCGEYSASASVSVEIDSTIVYRLPAASIGTTLVGTWDSGEMVFPSDGNISVVVDCEGTDVNAVDKFLILANGFFVRAKSGGFNMVFGGMEGDVRDSSENLLTFGRSTFSGNTLKSAKPFKFVITHAVGETTATIYVKDTNGTKGSATVTKKSTNTSWYGNSNLIVGIYSKRTVLNKLNVYNRVLSQSEIDAFLDS